MCKFSDMFVAEVIVKGGVYWTALHWEVISIYVHEEGRILETEYNAVQYNTTTSMTSMINIELNLHISDNVTKNWVL